MDNDEFQGNLFDNNETDKTNDENVTQNESTPPSEEINATEDTELNEDTLEDGINIINIDDEMKTSYLEYAMSVIVGRALPDARDGL